MENNLYTGNIVHTTTHFTRTTKLGELSVAVCFYDRYCRLLLLYYARNLYPPLSEKKMRKRGNVQELEIQVPLFLRYRSSLSIFSPRENYGE